MKTTHGSSFEYQSGLEWSVPSRWAPQLRADLDELQAYRAMTPVNPPDPAHARQCRSNDLEALVLKALENVTLNAKVVEALPCHRIGLVLKHLRKHLTHYGITKPPCHKTVKTILIKYNYL